jgi:hypothetical protein
VQAVDLYRPVFECFLVISAQAVRVGRTHMYLDVRRSSKVRKGRQGAGPKRAAYRCIRPTRPRRQPIADRPAQLLLHPMYRSVVWTDACPTGIDLLQFAGPTVAQSRPGPPQVGGANFLTPTHAAQSFTTYQTTCWVIPCPILSCSFGLSGTVCHSRSKCFRSNGQPILPTDSPETMSYAGRHLKFRVAKNNRSKSACTGIQRKRGINQAVWPVILGLRSNLRTRLSTVTYRRT